MLSWLSPSNQREGWLCSSGFGSKNLAGKAAPTVPGEELMCQDPGETHSYSVSSTSWYGTHYNGSPVGTAISIPFDSIISWVTSPLDSKETQAPPPQPGARLPGAVLQEGRCMFVTPLGDWKQFHTNWLKVSMKLLWEDPKGLECCVGTAPLYCQGKETPVWGHVWLRKQSLTLVQCMIFLSLHFPYINHFFVVLSGWSGLNHTILITC